jgi:prophage regulatory protein
MSYQSLLRLAAVKARTGYSRSTLYLRIEQGLWPRPVSLGARAVAWPDNEVGSLVAARIAGRSDAEIRELVQKLTAQRVLAAKG